MKKLLLIIFSTLMFFTSFNTYAKNLEKSNINKIAGLANRDLSDKILEYQDGDQKAIYIPAREVLSKLNYDIYWNNNEKSCYFKKGIKNIKVRVSSKNYITSNNNTIDLNRAPLLINQKLYLPLEVLYYLLDYDVFTIQDTIFIRNAVDGVKTAIVNEDKFTLTYPVFFSAEDVQRAYRNNINAKIKAFIDRELEKAKADSSIEHLYFTYDIARSDENLVSLCFYISKRYAGGKAKEEFYTKTYNYNSAEEIMYKDLLKNSLNVREKVLEDLTTSEDEKNSIRNNVKSFYMVDDAIIIYYYKDYEGSSKISTYYIRSEDLKYYINEEYLKYFN